MKWYGYVAYRRLFHTAIRLGVLVLIFLAARVPAAYALAPELSAVAYQTNSQQTDGLARWAIGDHSLFGYDTALASSRPLLDNRPYDAGLRLIDSSAALDSATTQAVSPNPDAPIVGPIDAPTAPSAVDTPISFTAAFTDPGVLGSLVVQWDWGDGSSTSDTLTQTGPTGSVSSSHAYSSPGIYTVMLTLTDENEASGESVLSDVVIYDAEGGFVTGGGWIVSPPGSYAPNPELTGKSNLGFVVKYKKGGTAPSGSLEFHFKDAGLKFRSESLTWLVMAKERAVFGGRGTLNGDGPYSFWVSVVDGKNDGGKPISPDAFRIQIRELIIGSGVIPGPIVYDNEVDVPDYIAPSTMIKGNIAFHQVDFSEEPDGESSAIVVGYPPTAALASVGIVENHDDSKVKVLLPLLSR